MTTVSARTQKLTPRAWDALAEALACFEWFKRPFESLVRRLFADAPGVLARLNFAEPKRRVTGQLVEELRHREAEYQGLIVDALLELAQYDPDFPHLARLDDGRDKVTAAQVALRRVESVTEQHSALVKERERVRAEFAERAADGESLRNHESDLAQLRQRFLGMFASPHPQQRGTDFESFLNELFALWDLQPRAAYNLAHEQVDGAFTFRTDDYLLEARWWNEPLQPKELNDFKVKVDGKARNTLGLYVAVNGFTAGSIELHSRSQSTLLLMDGADLMPILEGRVGLDEVLERKRRHAAETGNVMFRAEPGAE